MFESRPDLGLPTTIVALDGCLKAGLVGRSEDGSYAQTQAQPDHASYRIGILPRTLETVVVVELSVGGKPHRPPVFHQGIDDHFRADRAKRPSCRQPAMQRNSRQNRQLRPTADRQTFDRIETVQFGLSRRNRGRYQPRGGGGRRIRRRPSRTPQRRRIRLIVAIERQGIMRRAFISRWMAAAPYSPNGLRSFNQRRMVKTCCSMTASYVGYDGEPTKDRSNRRDPASGLRHADTNVARYKGNAEVHRSHPRRGSASHGSHHGPSLIGGTVFEPLQAPGVF